MNINEYTFDDSTVTNLSMIDKNLTIDIEDVLTLDNTLVNGRLKVINIKKITMDDNMVEEISMYYPDGEIIHLEDESGVLLLIVMWNDFDKKQSKTIAYKIQADKYDWQPKES